MSKIIKNEKMDEVNSNHLSQMKASIDSLIATHAADDDAHHAYATHLMIGAANSALIPCIFNSTTAGVAMDNSGSYLFQSTTTDSWWQFVLPIPHNRGGLKLYVKDVVLEVNLADVNDYVDSLSMYLIRDDARLNLINDGTNRTAQGTYIYTNAAADDASAYSSITVEVLVRMAGGAGDFRLASPSIECYYDT